MSGDRHLAEHEITRLLRAHADGRQSLNELMPIVYGELKSIASAQLRKRGRGARLETTMLVHETYEKLLGGRPQPATDRRHFYAIAARAMRQVIIDSYRADSASKRGGAVTPDALKTSDLIDLDTPEDMLQFNDAMQKLAAESEELAELVDLSCFGGLSNQEIAALTDTNVRTVQRKLARAQAWITTLLSEAG